MTPLKWPYWLVPIKPLLLLIHILFMHLVIYRRNPFNLSSLLFFNHFLWWYQYFFDHRIDKAVICSEQISNGRNAFRHMMRISFVGNFCFLQNVIIAFSRHQYFTIKLYQYNLIFIMFFTSFADFRALMSLLKDILKYYSIIWNELTVNPWLLIAF